MPTLAYRAIAVTTTPCLGSCPVYTATFRSDGNVTYRGESDVERMGEHAGRLGLLEYASLCEFIGHIHFADLRNAYRAHQTDGATVTITVTYNSDETKTVLDYGSSAPAEFWALHRVLEGLLTRVDWTEPQTR